MSVRVIDVPKKQGRQAMFTTKQVTETLEALDSANKGQAAVLAEGFATSIKANSAGNSFRRSAEGVREGVKVKCHVIKQDDGTYTAAASLKSE